MIQQPSSQNDNHDRDAEFEKSRDTFGNDDSHNNHQQTCNQKRCRVTQSPERADSGGLPDGSSFTDDGGNSRKMVRFCRVLQTQAQNPVRA